MWIHKHHEEIEKLICSKCPADINKDYSPCKNCKRGDDFELGYEAGLHADVHTDNSAVIAELETQIEIKDIQIKDLQEQKYYWKESSFDWRHKFFKKGRIKQLIEKENKIVKLEKEIKLLGERCNQLLTDKGMLTDELDKWKVEWNEQVIKANEEGFERTKQTIQLSKAKELIEDMYDKIPASHSDYYKDVMERARQFLSEVEK